MVWVDPKFNHKYPYRRESEGIVTTEEKRRKYENRIIDTNMDTRLGITTATRS